MGKSTPGDLGEVAVLVILTSIYTGKLGSVGHFSNEDNKLALVGLANITCQKFPCLILGFQVVLK